MQRRIEPYPQCERTPRCAPDRTDKRVHRWISDPKEGLPEWIRLDWARPADIQWLQLIFDTGLHRHLTLSHHDDFTKTMIWGRPQPETVKDYTIEKYDGREWKTLIQVKDNYQRLRRHTLPVKTTVSSLRILVTKTHGLDHARIVEVRVREKPWDRQPGRTS